MYERSLLPVMQYKSQILDIINNSQISLIVGETGSGKSTQIPQFIIEQAAINKEKCRVIVTEPRRIAALTIAERCAQERGEYVGQTVGYQIRLEKKTNYGSTHGFSRFGPVPSAINKIIDNDVEVDPAKCQNDENEALTEKALGTEKLKIVSEENDKNVDIKITDQREIDKLLDFAFERASVFDLVDLVSKIESLHLDGHCRHSISGVTPLAVVSSRGEMDLVKKLVDLGYVDEYSLGFSKTLAYKCGNRKVHSFLNSLDLRKILARCSKNEDETEHRRDSSSESNQFIDNGGSIVIKRGFGGFSTLPSVNKTVDNPLLNQYFDDFIDYDDQIDMQLIGELVFYIFKTHEEGAILIFLPGYEDIVAARDRISMDTRLSPYSPHICALHSQMSPKDQKEAFLRPPGGTRKIILSTNIAEVSVTINDVTFVIDCGKMKEKVYDGLSGISMLSNVWISKANAVQRKGRAGRCSEGFCYRLYSKLRFENMPENPIPEILRVPLHELCLQTKLMFPEIDKIQNILSLAPDAPSQFNIRNAICLLKIIGAMTENESLTTLGRRVCELPLEPQYGKMLLFSILFKCVDPVLTIVACLSYKDPCKNIQVALYDEKSNRL
uniref:Helicase C-terminal domain-containing protein n=1 Tax=Romanomermis culicivorax TaxID=13658 RepID=A0A915KBS7_ROMCU